MTFTVTKSFTRGGKTHKTVLYKGTDGNEARLVERKAKREYDGRLSVYINLTVEGGWEW